MTFKTLMITAAASAMIAGGAIAQETGTTGSDTGATTDMTVTDTAPLAPEFKTIDEMTVGDIVGQKVYEPAGETIGKIDYIITQGGDAEAVIGIGGFLGMGAYTVAVPLADFTYDATQKMVKLDTTKDALKERPEIDTANIEGLPNETPLSSVMASGDTSGTTGITEDGATDGAATDGDGAMEMGEETKTEETQTEGSTY